MENKTSTTGVNGFQRHDLSIADANNYDKTSRIPGQTHCDGVAIGNCIIAQSQYSAKCRLTVSICIMAHPATPRRRKMKERKIKQ